MTRRTPRASGHRGLSQAGSAALGFAVTILLISAAGAFMMQTGDELERGGPMASLSVDPVDAEVGEVAITHDSGRAIDLANVTVALSFGDGSSAGRLHALPTESVERADYDGNHVFELGAGGVGGAATPDGEDEWTSGETVRIGVALDRVTLREGDEIEVEVIHEETESTIASRTAPVV